MMDSRQGNRLKCDVNEWQVLTQLISAYIDEGKVIAGLGFCEQRLGGALPGNCEYFAIDGVKLSKGATTWDYNEYQFPNIYVDMVCVTGLLEYINDVDWFVEQTSNHADERIVLSYCCWDGASKGLRARAENNWVNKLTFDNLLSAFLEHGFAIEESVNIFGKTIFVFKRKKKRNPYGVVVYPTNWQNLGDYTQAAAIISITGRDEDAVYLRRENLHDYRGKELPLICNGWFSHAQVKLPSPKLTPMYISLHISKRAQQWFTDPLMLQHLREYAPIGCRDHATADFLTGHGVDAYWSGCVTLALGQFLALDGRTEPAGNAPVYLVDLPVNKPGSLFGKVFCVLKGGLSPHLVLQAWVLAHPADSVLRKLYYMLLFSGKYRGLINSLGGRSIRYRTQIVKIGIGQSRCNDLFKLAMDEIRSYRNSPAVITSRIHVALPAAAAGANVVFLMPGDLSPQEENRIADHTQFFNACIRVNRDSIPQQAIFDVIDTPQAGAPHGEWIRKMVSRQAHTIKGFLQMHSRA